MSSVQRCCSARPLRAVRFLSWVPVCLPRARRGVAAARRTFPARAEIWSFTLIGAGQSMLLSRNVYVLTGSRKRRALQSFPEYWTCLFVNHGRSLALTIAQERSLVMDGLCAPARGGLLAGPVKKEVRLGGLGGSSVLLPIPSCPGLVLDLARRPVDARKGGVCTPRPCLCPAVLSYLPIFCVHLHLHFHCSVFWSAGL